MTLSTGVLKYCGIGVGVLGLGYWGWGIGVGVLGSVSHQ